MREDINYFSAHGISEPFIIYAAGISYCDGSYKIIRRNSDIWCFEYIIKGCGTVRCGDAECSPCEGDVYFLPKGENHEYFSDSENPWIKIWFNIGGPLINELVHLYRLNGIYHVENIFGIRPLFDEFIKITGEKNADIFEIFSKASIIFHKIIQNLSKHITAPGNIPSDAKKIKTYIDRNIDKSIRINHLAGLIFRSQSQTIRLFKKAYGKTPYEYILTQKIEMSKYLLKNTNLTIKEISYKLSFADEHYFSNYFKSKTGVSPKQYKNM